MNALPPGPDMSPLDQARQWIERPLDLLDSCFQKFGDTFTLQLGAFGTMVILGHPESVRRVFKAPPEQFECRHFNESYRYVMGDNALFLQDGAPHRRLRRIVSPILGRENLQGFAHEIRTIAGQVLQEYGGRHPAGLRQWMQEISYRVLLRLLFGDREAAGEHILGLFRSQVWRDARAWKSWTNLSRLRPQICEFLAQELDYRRTRGVPAARPDMLDSLVASRDEAGEPLTDVEIQDQVFTLFITAGDALAVALTWAFVWVSKLPEVQARLRAEVLALGDSPNPVKMSQLPYLERVCQEVLRLHTVLPTVSGRRLLVPMELGGYPLPVGVLVAPCEYLVHRREDLYPEPLAFQPDRFLDRPYGPHEYFPFGGSNRTCMGGSLVPLEIKLALATTLSRCRVSLIDQEPADREPAGVVRYGTLLAPAGNLHVEIQDLSSAFVPAQPPISEPRGSHA